MDVMLLAKIALGAAVALLLWRRVSNARRREIEARDHMLDTFLPVVEGPSLRLSPWHYLNIQGRLDGRPARIDLIPDTLHTRSLPTLWLQARLAGPHDGWLSVTKEWNGAEYFSEDADAGTRLSRPPSWPANTVVRGDNGGSLALLHRMEHLDLDAYPSLKQLVVTGDEVKVTLRCARGDRAIYRVLRSGSFPADAVTPAIVAETLTVLRDVERTLQLTEDVA
jgi:hypothetical protein